VLAGGTGCPGDAIDGHLQFAATATPPLAQVFEPLRAVLFFGIGLVPHGELRGGALILAFDPHRQVRAVIFGYIQARNFYFEVQVRGQRRRGQSQQHRYTDNSHNHPQ
jgi:hypothetical protein